MGRSYVESEAEMGGRGHSQEPPESPEAGGGRRGRPRALQAQVGTCRSASLNPLSLGLICCRSWTQSLPGAACATSQPSTQLPTQQLPAPNCHEQNCPPTFHLAGQGLADHACVILLVCRPLVHKEGRVGGPGVKHDPKLEDPRVRRARGPAHGSAWPGRPRSGPGGTPWCLRAGGHWWPSPG